MLRRKGSCQPQYVFKFHYLMCTCVSTWNMHVEVREQFSGIVSLLPSCVSWGTKLWSWGRAPRWFSEKGCLLLLRQINSEKWKKYSVWPHWVDASWASLPHVRGFCGFSISGRIHGKVDQRSLAYFGSWFQFMIALLCGFLACNEAEHPGRDHVVRKQRENKVGAETRFTRQQPFSAASPTSFSNTLLHLAAC